jgi:hypothetical protein
MYDMIQFEGLKGKTFSSVERTGDAYDGNDGIIFTEKDTGHKYVLSHSQDCCENVYIEDIVGDLQDLVGERIDLANESFNSGNDDDGWGGSHTWSFYNIATIKGYVTIRFFGSSNGYYSESASLFDIG